MNADTERYSIDQSGITSAEVEQALATILADDKFAAAPQMSAFLAYVVKQTLLGEADRIKAYTVAVDALGKPPSFDPQNDPSVRVLAKRLRSSLDQYYERTQGHEVIIELKSGSYKPRFVRGSQQPPVPGTASETALRAADAYPGIERSSTGSLEHGSAFAPVQEGRPAAADAAEGSVPAGTEALMEQVRIERRDGEWYRTLGRIPRPVLAVLAVVGLGWATLENHEQRQLRADLAQAVNNPAVTAGDEPIRIALASASEDALVHGRPALPVVYIPRPAGDKFTSRVAAAVGSVMSRFELIDVMRWQPGMSRGQWPEEYELSFSSMKIGDRRQLDMQLLHAPSGRVAHVESLAFSAGTREGFTDRELRAIESFAARLAHASGPLIEDYRQQADISPAIACLADQQATANDADKTSGGLHTACPETWMSAENESLHATLARVRTRVSATTGQSVKSRAAVLGEALTEAQRAVERTPFSAAAHAMLMEVQLQAGQLDEALNHGRRALELNPYHTEALRTLATVMDELDKSDEGTRLRLQAARLDPRAKSS